jgi:metal-dependent HD superfamily phosphatase/phosphodiesterase
MKSPKEIALDKVIMGMTTGKPRRLAEVILHDPEVQALQEYANSVSIRRLGFNDHGPVHMRKVAINALIMAGLLADAKVPLSLEAEEAGSQEDSISALLLSAMLHDVGMSVGRQNHELNSGILGLPIATRILAEVYPESVERQVMLRSLVLECIEGHMATQRIHSLEAGLILIADGCDMEKGRARIPMLLNNEPRAGDIHQYSAASIESVSITKGDRLPIKIAVEMAESVGFFQVEEVLLQKVAMSPAKVHVELAARVTGAEARRYLG